MNLRRGGARLPRGRQEHPLEGVKIAYLGLGRPFDLSSLHFVAVRRPYQGPHVCVPGGLCYRRVAEAVCDERAGHAAPDEQCQCGFYAFRPDTAMAHNLEPGPNQWRLQVRLSGKVVVHEEGYRAQHQEVVSVEPPGRCGCQQGAPTMVVVDGRDVVVRCIRCAADAVAERGALVVRPAELERRLQVRLRRGHLAAEWIELLEAGLITRRADPVQPLVVAREVAVRVRGADGRVQQLVTDRSDVLGHWLLHQVGEGDTPGLRVDVEPAQGARRRT